MRPRRVGSVVWCAAMKHALGLGLVLLSACSLADAGSSEDVEQANQDIVGESPRFVDRPNRDITATHVAYYGGRVISNAKVYVVWWGTGTNLMPEVTRPTGGIADFFAGVLNTNYMDSMSQYNTDITVQAGSKQGTPGTQQRIGRGNYAGTYALTSIPSGNVNDAQISATIEAAINSGALPTPDDNTLFAIYFPRSVRIDIEGMRSCVQFGAYHFATPANQHHVAYAVMPDCGYNFAGVTRVTSHELIEAVTDAVPTPGSNPNYPQAWNTSDGSEVSDLCVSSTATIPTPKGNFSVQGWWDELARGCKITHTSASDFAVVTSGEATALTTAAGNVVTFQTATAAGGPQRLALSVTAPTGVTATLSSSSVTSGESVTVSLAAAAGVAIKDGQVVLTAVGTTGAGPQVHTASVLVHVR
jgi:hypothetical protein